MTASIPALVVSAVKRTGLPSTYVTQRARELQNAGLLPIANGANRPAVRPRHLAHLLIGLASDRVRKAPALVHEYASLERIHFADLIVEGHADVKRAGDAIETIITSVWAGNCEHRGDVFRIVQHPEAKIVILDDKGYGEHFYTPGTFMEFHRIDAVTRAIEIPVSVIAEIGADLGFKGCNYAI